MKWSFTFNLHFMVLGEVMMSKNGGSSITLMYVDNSVPLWAFFDLYGTTTKVFLLGKVPAPARTGN